MTAFDFFCVGRIVFGRQTVKRIGELSAAFGRRALMVTNAGQTERRGSRGSGGGAAGSLRCVHDVLPTARRTDGGGRRTIAAGCQVGRLRHGDRPGRRQRDRCGQSGRRSAHQSRLAAGLHGSRRQGTAAAAVGGSVDRRANDSGHRRRSNTQRGDRLPREEVQSQPAERTLAGQDRRDRSGVGRRRHRRR